MAGEPPGDGPSRAGPSGAGGDDHVSGRGAVAAIGLVAATFCAGYGFVLGVSGFVGPGTASLGPLRFPLTPLGLAAYGMLAGGVVVGSLLAAVPVVVRAVEARRRRRS